MVMATVLGGPMDGSVWALQDDSAVHAVKVPVMRPPQFPFPDEWVRYDVVTMTPELTANGWVLRWHEP